MFCFIEYGFLFFVLVFVVIYSVFILVDVIFGIIMMCCCVSGCYGRFFIGMNRFMYFIYMFFLNMRMCSFIYFKI